MEDQTIAIATATHQNLHHRHHQQQHLADAVPVIIRNLVDHFLRLRLQLFLLILSISLLSILSLTLLLLPYKNNNNNLFCLSTTLLVSLFTHTLDRKYMFLLCNGILALLAKSFCFSTTTTTTSVVVVARDPDELADPQLTIDVNVKSSVGSDGIELPGAEADHREMGNPSLLEADGDRVESEGEEMDSGLEFNEETPSSSAAAAASSDVAMADINTNDDCDNSKEDLMSTEELNKKIEEFIRKMKEEIRIEAQTRLIAV